MKESNSIPLVFLHGLEGSPQGFKATRLKQYEPECWCPSLTPDVRERVKKLEMELKTPSLLVGSSLGGLTAIAYAMKHSEMVLGMVLLAPAVGVFRSTGITGADEDFLNTTFIPLACPTVIIAANQDEIIPMESIEALVHRSSAHSMLDFKKVDSDHALNSHHELMLSSIEWIKEKIEQANASKTGRS
jgi:pimeloyl-ACP methyl ester carboxylesterase